MAWLRRTNHPYHNFRVWAEFFSHVVPAYELLRTGIKANQHGDYTAYSAGRKELFPVLFAMGNNKYGPIVIEDVATVEHLSTPEVSELRMRCLSVEGMGYGWKQENNNRSIKRSVLTQSIQGCDPLPNAQCRKSVRESDDWGCVHCGRWENGAWTAQVAPEMRRVVRTACGLKEPTGRQPFAEPDYAADVHAIERALWPAGARPLDPARQAQFADIFTGASLMAQDWYTNGRMRVRAYANAFRDGAEGIKFPTKLQFTQNA